MRHALARVAVLPGGDRVEIRRAGVELRRAGVHHLVAGLLRRAVLAGYSADGRRGVAERPRAHHVLRRQAAGELRLQLRHAPELFQEPAVDARDAVQLLHAVSGLQRLKEREEALIVHVPQPFCQRPAARVGPVQRVELYLRAAHGLHQRRLKGGGDGHHLAGGLHLRPQGAAGPGELVEGPARQLDHHIVQRGLEAGEGLARDLVFYLVERVAQGDLGAHLGNRVARGLAGQGRGARDARVDLDHGVVEALRVEGELAVAAAGDAHGGDDVQCRRAQHLILPVGQRQRRGHDDAVPRVYAHGVHVLHAAHGDGAARRVPHDLELDLLPAEDVLLHQYLPDGRGLYARGGHALQLRFRVCHAPAAAAEGEGRPHDDRVADGARRGERGRHRLRRAGGDGGLADGLHGVLEELPVLALEYGVDVGADQAHAVRAQEAAPVQLHGDVQPRLPAEPGEQAVGPLRFDDALHRARAERLYVNAVRHAGVGHDGGGVGVDEHGLHALRHQRAAGLRAGVVELRRLPYDDRPRADHERLFYAAVLRHSLRLPSSRGICRTCRGCPAARRGPPGGTAGKRPSCPGNRAPRSCRR